ncbi:MAG: hypothetical protein HN576_00890 [Bacteriovoracaceae bacterium]|jgi:hypothetical protein|nr:hypothetical protein [Bacteriovoracaceae bacterium]
MKKKYLIGFALLILVLSIIYISSNPKQMRTNTDFGTSHTSQVKKEQDLKEAKINQDDEVVNKEQENIISVPDAHLDPNELSESEIAEFEDYFEEVEKNWITRIESLFVSEFTFEDEKMEEYMDIRDRYEEEKMIAFQEFNEFMVSKYGENYTFTPTKDMEVFENKLESVYKEKMRAFVGDENYIRYREVLEEYNERLRQEQDPDKGIILIEL